MMKNYSTKIWSIAVVLRASVCVVFTASMAQAAIIGSGDVKPVDPTTWTSSTWGEIGRYANGNVTVDGGSELLSDHTFLGDSSGSTGSATVTGIGSKWTNNGDLSIGNYGNGTLKIEAGGQVSNIRGYLGYFTESTGSATITGTDSKWVNNGYLYVGHYGSGVLNIEAGGQVSCSDSILGYYSAGSSGTATVTGTGSRWTVNNSLFVGQYGNGKLTVADGGVVNTGDLYASLGDLLGNGTITAKGIVLDADLVFDGTHGLTQTLAFGTDGKLNIDLDGTGVLGVGHKGVGTLQISEGKSITSSHGYLGYQSGSTGSATITGLGSTWTTTGNLVIGHYGCGMLNIEAGGEVSNASGYVGNNNSSATVRGIGSKWSNSGSLNIGASPNDRSTLTVGAGGQVSSDYCYIESTSKTASVTVTGAGSKWTVTNHLHVGHIWGNGTLTVSDGGVVTAGTLCAPLSSLLGNGTIATEGAVLDADLLFDGSHGLQQTLMFGSGGTLTLDLNGSGALGAGYKGTGTLRIADGVVAVSAGGYLGYHAGSVGNATVTGTGSKWTAGSLLVGYYGTGNLIIEAGGQVSNSNSWLGCNFTSPNSISIGTVTVTGIGSSWTNRNLNVGQAGKGILNIGTGIASGGLVTAKTLVLANYENSQGICNLNGGTLQVESMTIGSSGYGSRSAEFNWNDGTIRNYNAGTNLSVSYYYYENLVLKLAATGTHTFHIDPNRQGIIGAVLSDATSGGTLVKMGGGSLTLTATNTYTGSTTISEGTLALSSTGTLASSVIDVGYGATFDVSSKSGGFSVGTDQTLKGLGTILGTVTINGIHAPGNLTGYESGQKLANVETIQGNYTMLGQLSLELRGATLRNYEQVRISSNASKPFNVTLGGSLVLDWTGMSGSTDSTKLWILQNDTAGLLSGTFSNYTNGVALGYHDGREWFLWYGANAMTRTLTGGNDVVIAAVPEPCMLMLLSLSVVSLLAYAWRSRK